MPNEVTGIDSQDQGQALADLVNKRLDGLEASLKEQLGSEVERHQLGSTNDKNAPGEYVLNIHGKEFKYKNAQEASKAVEDALVETREMTTFALQDEINKRNGNQPTKPENKGPDPRERFSKIVTEDPLAGINYALGQLIFGQEVPDAGRVIREGMLELNRLRQVQSADQFRRTVPTFTGSPEDVRALEQVRQEFNLPVDNPKALELAFNTAVSRGLIKPQSQNQSQQTQQSQYAQNGYSVPPMTSRQNTEEMPDWVSRAEKLPTAQLEKFLTEFQQGRN